MKCPNCKSTAITLFHDKVWSIDDGKVYRCNGCELLFINPMMSAEEEIDFYNNYNQHVYNRGVTEKKSVVDFHQKSLTIAHERLKVIKNYFNQAKVLEIGSSTGAFLSLLANCQTYACELSDENRDYSRQFINGKAFNTIEEVDENDFDVICMFHVFEHIREPVAFLNSCRPLLKKDGHIIIEVPHSNDPLITLYDCREFKDFVFQPMHPMIYNEKSLNYVFEKAGFEKVEIIYSQRYGLDNHLSWFKNKKSGGDAALNALFCSNLDYRNSLEDAHKTDTLFYVARLSTEQN